MHLIRLSLKGLTIGLAALACVVTGVDAQAQEKAEHRRDHDGRRRLGRPRLLRRRGDARRAHPASRPDGRRRDAFRQLLRPGELHGRPRLVHHRPHPDSHRALAGAVARRS